MALHNYYYLTCTCIVRMLLLAPGLYGSVTLNYCCGNASSSSSVRRLSCSKLLFRLMLLTVEAVPAPINSTAPIPEDPAPNILALLAWISEDLPEWLSTNSWCFVRLRCLADAEPPANRSPPICASHFRQSV
jgi:hypothetical protein